MARLTVLLQNRKNVFIKSDGRGILFFPRCCRSHRGGHGKRPCHETCESQASPGHTQLLGNFDCGFTPLVLDLYTLILLKTKELSAISSLRPPPRPFPSPEPHSADYACQGFPRCMRIQRADSRVPA